MKSCVSLVASLLLAAALAFAPACDKKAPSDPTKPKATAPEQKGDAKPAADASKKKLKVGFA